MGRSMMLLLGRVAASSCRSTVQGLGGDDLLEGHTENDTIYGGPGRDWLRGGAECDQLHAGDGEPDHLIDCEGGGGTVKSSDGADPSPVTCGGCP